MKITVIASTKPNYVATKEELENFSGHAAGVCYMPDTFETLMNEPKEKTDRRIIQTKSGGHHSVYDHENISFQLEGVPKLLAMLLNNEKMYTTSEKSARYTKMELSEKEQTLFNKWLEVFKNKIKDLYQAKYPNFFTDKRIEKLALENARYLNSIFTPTFLVYTCSYRQLNILYSFLQKEINRENKNILMERLTPYMQEFCDLIKQNTPYFDEYLARNEKQRGFSLFNQTRYVVEEHYGDTYSTTYLATTPNIAQAMRHRTLNYTVNIPEKYEYYVPIILRDDENLTKEWLADIDSLKDNFPQGILLEVNEMGTLDNFILKLKERKCTFAQLEIERTSTEVLTKYVEGLKAANHPRYNELKAYNCGSRCTFPDYTCPCPCGIIEGIKGTRKF
ncbi:MAG: FAD-dependent thymidylate synthase [Clostridia bacterium]|nr:FAD-dependent thymidylate synthase [Clostridia bacterium]